MSNTLNDVVQKLTFMVGQAVDLTPEFKLVLNNVELGIDGGIEPTVYVVFRPHLRLPVHLGSVVSPRRQTSQRFQVEITTFYETDFDEHLVFKVNQDITDAFIDKVIPIGGTAVLYYERSGTNFYKPTDGIYRTSLTVTFDLRENIHG